MITAVQADRLAVISDLHLGNPYSRAKRATIQFFDRALEENFDIVINGDGFEIAQVSFAKLAKDVPEVLHAMKAFTQRGRNIYYVIGNHDILLENFLNDWGGFKMAPFLNLQSGSARIRIEHGHLYDPAFINNPRLYEFLTATAGLALQIHPGLYRLWIAYEKLKSRFLWNSERALEAVPGQAHARDRIVGENPAFTEAARELCLRGFDAVVFGHTHHAGAVDLGGGAQYFNSGSWLMGCPYIWIDNGHIELRKLAQ